MRVVTPKKLVEYSTKNPQAKIPLLYWYGIVKKANCNSLSDIKKNLTLCIMLETIDMYSIMLKQFEDDFKRI